MGLFSTLAIQEHANLTTGIHGVTTKVTDWDGDNTAIARKIAYNATRLLEAFESGFLIEAEFTWNRLRIYDGTSTAFKAICGVELPDGAVITALKVHGYKNAAGTTMTVSLYRITKECDAAVQMAVCAMPESVAEVTDSSIGSDTINNSLYHYLFQLDYNSASGVSSFVNNMQIDYTVLRPQP